MTTTNNMHCGITLLVLKIEIAHDQSLIRMDFIAIKRELGRNDGIIVGGLGCTPARN